jgi:small-conductance mechanosensitive channel
VEFIAGWTRALEAAGIIAAAFAVGALAEALLFRALIGVGHLLERVNWLERDMLEAQRPPAKVLMGLGAVYAAWPLWRGRVGSQALEIIDSAAYILFVLAVAWLLTRITNTAYRAIKGHYDITRADNLEVRKLLTHVEILRRFVWVAICVVAIAAILLHFEGFRELGAGLLASAGVVGIILGIAAQRTLGTVIAGFQIAITQPIRVDDVVIVEGEWGRIEEITLTYVVVRVWDLRRLVVPISHFIEKPFQNWTRETSNILGTVFLRADYTLPVDALRAEFERLLEASELWDGEVAKVHVTDAGERTMEVRALMSTADSGSAWELRCYVREKLVTFLQQNHPECLPRVRGQLNSTELVSG